MANEEEKELNRQNQIGVAAEKGKNALEVARVTGHSREAVAGTNKEAKVESSQNYSKARVDAAMAKVNAEIAKEVRLKGQSAAANQMRGLVAKVSTGGKLEPNEQAVWDKVMAGTPDPSGGQQQAAPQQQAPAASPQAPPVQGAKLYKGQWYTRGPNGESVPYQSK